MITGDDDPPKMIGAKRHKVMTHNMDLSSVKKELLRQVKLSNDDSFIDEAVSAAVCCVHHTTTTTILLPFSGTTWVSQCQSRTSGLYGARED